MKKVIVIGCSGSGKSTLARRLGQITQLPVVHLDRLWWKPGWETVSRDEFDVLHRAAMAESAWIIDGNFSRTWPERIESCDTAIYLDFNRFVCIMGVLRRVLSGLGKVRPDMGEGCPERFDWHFLLWVWNFNKKNRRQIHQLLSKANHTKIYILKTRKQVNKFLSDIEIEYKGETL
jgi:adenylate kinase family enzyme